VVDATVDLFRRHVTNQIDGLSKQITKMQADVNQQISELKERMTGLEQQVTDMATVTEEIRGKLHDLTSFFSTFIDVYV
jgi:predicted  nucleic acid-binding Zn-ribbon protein